MPTIFDNIERNLLDDLKETIGGSYRADFCVGYFNLRGWRLIEEKVEELTGGEGANCRLLVGMVRHPSEEVKLAFGIGAGSQGTTQAQANESRKEILLKFRQQLVIGAPTNEDEAGLRRLRQQLAGGKVTVKLFLRHPLHAKLYLLHFKGVQPRIGYLGSSNLTFSGLSGQGELNIDVRDIDASRKLADWFEERWEDRLCIDITADLIEILDESWAREVPVPPYHIYLKMAYHLSREAQRGINEFTIPNPFDTLLFDFQKKAVQIAARYLNQRNGVLIGDVVGLGKTLMASALAKIFQEDLFLETLIICPKNLEEMWKLQVEEFGLRAKVLPISQTLNGLEATRRYRLVIIDESHNLRNREGKRYGAIRQYIERNECRCILLTATPYNKTYLDLANQLRLFVDQDADLGIRPEQLIREISIVEFSKRYDGVPPRSLRAFEASNHADDWRELMRLYLVRRTRSFIRDNYARQDAQGHFLEYPDGSKFYFPARNPLRLDFNENVQYTRLYSEEVVDTINELKLPRYGLGLYARPHPQPKPDAAEQRILSDLSRGGRRLMGFCRTNLFKRLESSGYAFLLSVERHILRNYVYLHALEHGLDVPIGTQDVAVLDTRFEDADVLTEDSEAEEPPLPADSVDVLTPEHFRQRAAQIYQQYAGPFKSRFRWLRPDLFGPALRRDLQQDAEDLLTVLMVIGQWRPDEDAKLDALHALLTERHAREKVLVFSQFADSVDYLARQLHARGLTQLEGVTGDHPNPTEPALRFSPASNKMEERISPEQELRVLIATDVLSEGQNLQDGYIVVNYDLPWAIIRLIQRAGRVDRIGQKASHIYCYSIWPSEGVERIIGLRDRLRRRLNENAEVVGADETFFEDEDSPATLRDLYNERAGILDDEQDRDVDLVSQAYEIWKQAVEANPDLQRQVERLPDVVFSAKAHHPQPGAPAGALVYVQTNLGNSALLWMSEQGESVSQSQYEILRAAECALNEPAMARSDNHHQLVRQAVDIVMAEQRAVGVQLGRPSGARFKTYERIKSYLLLYQHTLFADTPKMRALAEAFEQLGNHRLRESAKDQLNRQLRSGVNDDQLADIVRGLYEENKLCVMEDDDTPEEPQIKCSLGLV